MKKTVWILIAFTALACGRKEKKIVEIQDGEPCQVESNEEGDFLICPNQEPLQIRHGEPGPAGSPGPAGPRGPSGPAGSPGTPGNGGETCSIENTDDGFNLTCPDGTTGGVRNGDDGRNCTAESRDYGADIICDGGIIIPIRHGRNGGGIGRGGGWDCRGSFRYGRYTWQLSLRADDFLFGENLGHRQYKYIEAMFEGNVNRGSARVGNLWDRAEVIPMVGPEFDATLNVETNSVLWRFNRNGQTWTTRCTTAEIK